MKNQYEELDIVPFLGLSLETVVNKLIEYRAQNKLVSARFNGVTLYSDTVTMDNAHLKIVGMTKSEFDAHVAGLSTE